MSSERGHWLQTSTGRAWFPETPLACEVHIEDIAHALSQLCRYGGHTKEFYSVAEHSVHVSRLVPPEHALCGLLHDATEAYVVDMPKPVKVLLPDYNRVEAAHWRVIAERFGLPEELPEEVKKADLAILFVEKAQVLIPSRHRWMDHDWGMGAERDPAMEVEVRFWTPRIAEMAFLRRFQQLTRKAA